MLFVTCLLDNTSTRYITLFDERIKLNPNLMNENSDGSYSISDRHVEHCVCMCKRFVQIANRRQHPTPERPNARTTQRNSTVHVHELCGCGSTSHSIPLLCCVHYARFDSTGWGGKCHGTLLSLCHVKKWIWFLMRPLDVYRAEN